ncbi:hypothetical protein BpHYR1_028592, partial [Brachionus plicatilis]
SKAYECAVVSESSVEYFNGRVSYYAPLRNEEHKTVLVLEITSQEYFKNEESKGLELPQIEIILYILHKCQEELLEAHFLGITNNQYEFESLHEQDKFDILFEKRYINFICETLKENIGTSIETEESNVGSEIIKFISDLVSYQEFNEKKAVDGILIDKMERFDPTVKNFNFVSSNFDLSSDESIKSLVQIRKDISGSMPLIRLLIDFAFLVKDLRSKSKL